MKKSQVVWLKKEKQINRQPLPAHILQWCVWIILLELLWLANRWMIRDVFEILVLDKEDVWKLALWISVVVILKEILQSAILLDRQRAKMWRFLHFMWITCVVFALFLIFKRNQEELWKGMLAITDRYVQAINYYYKLSIPSFMGEQKYISDAMLFWCLPLVFVSYGLARKCKKRWMLFLPTVAIVGAELAIGYGPQWKSVLLCIAVAGMFAVGRWNDGGAWKGDLWAYGVLGVFVCVLAVAGNMLGERITAPFMEKAPELKGFQADMERTVTNFSVVSLFSNDNSVNNRTPEYVDKQIMKITVQGDQPFKDLYVRTGYGLHYKGGTWTTDEKELQKQAQEAGYDEKEINLLVSSALEENTDNPNKDYERMEVEACDKVESFHMQQQQKKGYFSMQFGQGDDLFFACSQHQQRFITSDSLQAIEVPENYPLWKWYDCYLKDEIQRNYQVDAIVKQLYHSAMMEEFGTLEAFMNREWDTIGEGLSEEEAMYALYFMNYEMNFLAAEVRDLIQQDCKYQLYLDRIPDGRDAIEYFLDESHQGYCVHFASAATLFLQKLGVPARYCTGYIVKHEAFSKDSEGVYTAEVVDRNAHAWVEIFYQGVGWIPYEMTPGYEYMRTLPTDAESMEELREKKQLAQSREEASPSDEHENANTDDQHDKTEQSATDQKDSESEDDSQKSSEQKEAELNDKLKEKEQNSNPMKDNLQNSGVVGHQEEKWNFRGWRDVLVVFGVVLIIAGIAYFPVFLRRRRNQQEKILWEKKRYRKYVRWINYQICRKLQRHGLIRWDIAKDKEIKGKIGKLCEELKNNDVERYMRIVQKAAFGNEVITKEDAEFCKRIYHKIRKDNS